MMAVHTKKQNRTGFISVLLLWVVLLFTVSACQQGTPEPSPSTPPAPRQESVHFTAQGDFGLGSGARQVLDAIADLDPQLNIALGDFSYQAGKEQQFCDMVTDKLGQDFPFELITGNHESDGHDGAIEKFVQCLPNKLPGLQGEYGIQWYVDVPQQDPLVRFVMVSPGIEFRNGEVLDYSPGSERWNWTTAAIDGAASADIPWTVVGMHVPCLSVGTKDCQAGQEFTNMLINKKVDLVLSGHDHDYQRTHQIGTGDSRCPELAPAAFTAGCLFDADSTMEAGAGTVFTTVGTGGSGLYNVHDDDPEAGYFATWSGKNRNPALGTLDVTATDDSLTARFVPADGSSFTDSFKIEKRQTQTEP